MARLSTHVLDTSRGVPAAGVQIDLYLWQGQARKHVTAAVTNADGRTADPLLSGDSIQPGVYELVFQAGAYFGSGPELPFLDEIVIRFGLSDAHGHYHVPLLLSPYGYTTYRGS